MGKNSSYDEDMDELRIEGSIAKVDDEKRQVFGWASVTEINGDPVVDLQGDLMETYELEKAAYDYVLNSRVGGEMHERVGKSSPKQVGTLIESMVITPEKIEKMGLPPETPHGWWIGFQVGRDDFGDKAWDKVKKGDYTGFSIHGLGKRQSMEKHLIGRHEQKDHGRRADELDRDANPEGKGKTKFKGLPHARKEHKELREAKAFFGDENIADLNRGAFETNEIIDRLAGGGKPSEDDAKAITRLLGNDVGIYQSGDTWGVFEHEGAKLRDLKPLSKGVMTREVPEYLAWLEKISGVSGITPKQIDQDLRGWMQSEGVDDPDDDDIHDFLTTAYGSGEEETVDKHFVEFFKNIIQIPAHERAGVTVRAHTRNLGQRAKEASQQAEQVARDFYDKSKPKEKVMAAAYTTIAGAAAGLAGNYARHGSPRAALLYGAYGLASATLAGLTVNDVVNPDSDVKKNLNELDDATQELADALGVEPEQLLEDLGDWMGEQKELTVDDMTEFIRDTYGNEVVKHLIGRHEQKDHDPTKGKSDRSHAREDHDSVKTSAGATMGGLAGLLGGGVLGAAALGTLGAQAGSQAGAKDRAKSRRRLEERRAQGPSPMEAAMERTGMSEQDVLIEAQRLVGEGEPIMSRDFNRIGKALIYKAAEKAKSHQEFADNVEEIGKALVDHDPEMAGYFEDVHKHLIGRHEQDDHDPTKKGRGGHSRDQHKGKSPTGANRNPGKGAAIGAGAMGALAGGVAARFGLGGAARYAAQGALGGSAAGYQLGGGQIFGNPNESRLGGVAAGTGNFLAGGNLGIVPGVRRMMHGDPNEMYRTKKSLSKRQIEVLEKYLGKNAIEEI